MTYKEYFQHLRERRKAHPGRQLTEQELDQQIALLEQLPCNGRGPRKPIFSAQHSAIEVSSLDRGAELPAEYGCMHCTMLAAYKFFKSVIEAERNGTPLPPMP